jgi:hypothetical protein
VVVFVKIRGGSAKAKSRSCSVGSVGDVLISSIDVHPYHWRRCYWYLVRGLFQV